MQLQIRLKLQITKQFQKTISSFAPFIPFIWFLTHHPHVPKHKTIGEIKRRGVGGTRRRANLFRTRSGTRPSQTSRSVRARHRPPSSSTRTPREIVERALLRSLGFGEMEEEEKGVRRRRRRGEVAEEATATAMAMDEDEEEARVKWLRMGYAKRRRWELLRVCPCQVMKLRIYNFKSCRCKCMEIPQL